MMTGRDRRLRYEEELLSKRFDGREDIQVEVAGRNAHGYANKYRVTYNIRCMCGVENVEHLCEEGQDNKPVYADRFVMMITLPPAYPSIDGKPQFEFCTTDENYNPIPHPWHPNIRWFGAMAGRVCLNAQDTYTDLAWGVSRVAQYLRYEVYHAINEPPYPEDLQVARWITEYYEKK